MYKKAPEATETYVCFRSVKDYVMHILGDTAIADVVVPCVDKVCKLLSEPSCHIIQQMRIDYDYIEVHPKGWFFNIPEKTFIKDPKNLKGSPRTFVLYTYTPGRVPTPLPFIEGKITANLYYLEIQKKMD